MMIKKNLFFTLSTMALLASQGASAMEGNEEFDKHRKAHCISP
jgi:hypothetical protein